MLDNLSVMRNAQSDRLNGDQECVIECDVFLVHQFTENLGAKLQFVRVSSARNLFSDWRRRHVVRWSANVSLGSVEIKVGTDASDALFLFLFRLDLKN